MLDAYAGFLDRLKGPDFPRNQVLFGGNFRTQTSALLGVKICRDVKELLLGGAEALSQRHRFAVAIVACRQKNRCFQDRAFTVLPALSSGDVYQPDGSHGNP